MHFCSCTLAKCMPITDSEKLSFMFADNLLRVHQVSAAQCTARGGWGGVGRGGVGCVCCPYMAHPVTEGRAGEIWWVVGLSTLWHYTAHSDYVQLINKYYVSIMSFNSFNYLFKINKLS